MNNPLLTAQELPAFSAVQPEHVTPAIELLIAENQEAITALKKSKSRDFVGMVKQLDELEDRLNKAWSPVSHMNSVVNNDALREVYNHCLSLLNEYSTRLGQDQGLFAIYQGLEKSKDFESLSLAQRQAIRNALRDFRLSGVDLTGEVKEQCAEVKKKLSEITSRFSEHVMDATDAWYKLIDDVEDLRGLPENAIALTRQSAEQRNLQGYLLTLDFPCYFPLMTYCENRDLRKEMYIARSTRASDQGPGAADLDNSQLMQDILIQRKALAEILGFENFAELSLATKMAETPQQVLAFLMELAEKSKPVADQEFAEVEKFAAEHLALHELQPWDIGFCSEKLKIEKFDLSEEQLRPYFPVPVVISGMFEVVRKLFDIEVRESTDIETWHADVTTFDIFRDGSLIARFYLDLYARPKKSGGAWMDGCRTRRIRLDGNLQLPVAYLTCNFPSPLGDTASLLSHSDVVTLFHEFGHGLHHMLTQIDCAPVSGINGVAWDAVELPSQFLENWCWERESLPLISAHFQTGEPLPEDLLDKMLAAKNFQSGLQMMRQVEFALFDLRLHIEFDEHKDNQIQTILDQVRSEVSVVPVRSDNRFQHAFDHIFGSDDGYEAGYYSYKWAEVLSADAFSKFREEGIFNRQTGELFLSTVLEQGGSKDPMDLFTAFRGRKPTVDALLSQEGIADLNG
jgi:oligopeptidase A